MSNPQNNPLTPATRSSTLEIATSRQAQEVQAAMVIAQKCPRDEVAAFNRVIQACSRKELAEVAAYQFSRGGTKITGASIHLLRAIAKRWGNINFGWTEVSREDGRSLIVAHAWDLETNVRSEMTFSVKHWRDTQSGGYALKDERDIYELCANQASRRVRACLEAIIDEDIVNSALEKCETTLKSGHNEPLADRIKKMIVAFTPLGITQAMIEKKLQHKIDATSEGELVQLRRIFTSLNDGMSKREDWFDAATAASGATGDKPEHTIPKDDTGKPSSRGGISEPVAAPKAATPPQSPPPATTQSSSDDEEWNKSLAKVHELSKEQGFSEKQVLDYCKKAKLAGRMCEEIAQMSTKNLQVLIDEWPTAVEKINGQSQG